MRKVSINLNQKEIIKKEEEDYLNDEFYLSKDYNEIKKKLKVKYKLNNNQNNNSNNNYNNTSNNEYNLKSSLKKPKTPGLGIGGIIHLPPLHINDVNDVSDMIHRVTLQSGIEPGLQRIVKTPASILDKASHMAELQLKNMMESSEIKDLLHEILEVHNSINNFAQSLGHRQAAAKQLEESNKLNLKLFQRIISEILMLHRHKFQSQTQQCNYLEEKVQHLENQLAYYIDDSKTARSRISQLEFRCEELEQLWKAKDAEIEVLSTQLNDLQITHNEFFKQLNLERIEREKEQEQARQKLEKALIEERNLLLAQRHEMLLQLMRENELHHQSMLLQEEKKNRFKKPTEPQYTQKSVSTNDSWTQTEVDDFGLWHKQDGWTLPISGTILARNLWKKACRFATCPSCKGIGRYMARAVSQFHKLQRGELDNDINMKQLRASGTWILPDELVQFMSNLPRTIEASKLWPLSRTIRYWWNMLNLKIITDSEDDKYGYGIQKLPEFIIETFLMRTENRHEAEIQLYHLTTSLKEYVLVKKNPFLHTFARFLAALDPPSVIGNNNLDDSENEIKKPVPKNFLLNNKGLIRTTSSALPTSILTVYMFARNCFLLPYRGEYATAISIAKSNSEIIQKNQAILESPTIEEGDNQSEWFIQIPPHICTLEKFQMWLPLDRAVFVTRAILHFLSEKHMTIMLKHIESMAMFLSSQGVLEEPDGNHTVIRAAMRRFQEMSSESVTSNPSANVSVNDNKTIVVNMDKLLQAIIELLLGRVKYLEDQLKKQFIEGDDNGDGVLSFNEFLTMMTKMAPHFPKRRILRMFREALMRGNDDAHIDQQSFVEVCKQHGLAQLVDINSLKKTVLAELHPPELIKKERKASMIKPNRESLDDSPTFSQRSPLTMAEVALATKALRRMISRQSSQTKTQAMEEAVNDSNTSSPAIRRNLSEEVQASSKEITETVINALVSPQIRRISSDDHLPVLRKSAQILDSMRPTNDINDKKTSKLIENEPTKQKSLKCIPEITSQHEVLTSPLHSNSKLPAITNIEIIQKNSDVNNNRHKLPSARMPSGSIIEEDEDGKIIPLSSIRKSISQTPRITPKQTPQQTPRITPRITPRNVPKTHLTQRQNHHLLNSNDILSLSETDESIDNGPSRITTTIDPSDPLTIILPSASSQILFGSEEPNLADI